MPRTERSARRRLAAALLAAALGSQALAVQDEVEAPPPPNRSLTLQSPVVGYGIMALAAAALVGVSLMRSKRGAQD